MFNRSDRPILIIEDNPVDLDLTLRAFSARKIGNPVQVARDGEEALDFIRKWDEGLLVPGLILLDLNMPKINGLEVLERIKSHSRYKSIPVVVLTTSSESSDLKNAYSLGANSYIVKPVDFGRFLEVAGTIDTYWLSLNRHL